LLPLTYSVGAGQRGQRTVSPLVGLACEFAQVIGQAARVNAKPRFSTDGKTSGERQNGGTAIHVP
jgi:hypothetical protein